MAKKRIWHLLTVVLAIVLCAALLCACKGDKGAKGDKGLQGEQGVQGERGPAGSDGADGDMWYVGNGDPSNNALADTKSGDMYLDSDSGDVYQKQPDGSWQLKANIKGLTGETGKQGPQGEQGDEGLQGEQGVQGERGPAGSDGADGDMWYVGNGDPSNNALADTKSGDMYLDSDSGDVYQKQPDGSWQLKANIKGLTGETGIQGPQGEQGDKGDKGDKGDDAPHANEILTVTFDAQDGELPQEFPQEQRVNYGDVLQLPVPTRDNYTFVGWYTGDSVNDGKFTTVTPVTKDITLFARWQVKTKYRVTFDTCDGDPMDTIDYFADEQIANLPEPTRADYDFVGWYSDEHFVNAVQYPLTLSGNIVVYAQWKKASYTVTFHVNQGSTPSPVTAEAGTSLSSFEAAQVPDYVFDGWYYNQEYTSRVEFPLELHSDLDIYGKWTADPFAGYTRVQDFMQLQNITDMSGKYVLTEDIDCLGLQISMFAPDGNPFKGVFDGAGHKIFNFTLYVTSGMKIGFFGVNEGTIKNLKLEQNTTTVSGTWRDANGDGATCGFVAGYNKGTIESVWVSSTINYINSCTSGTSSGSATIAGGIVGKNVGTITDAHFAGTIKAVSTSYLDHHYVGGIAGENTGTVTNALVTGTVISETDRSGGIVGGIVGYNSGKIENSLFVGSVNGTEGKCALNAICVLDKKGSSVKCYKAYTITIEGGSPAIESALNSKSFYTDMLGWDEAIWNFDSLDFAQGQYPQLR